MINRCTFVFAQANKHHLHQATLNFTHKTGVRLHAIHHHHVVGLRCIFIEINGHTKIRHPNLNHFHRRLNGATHIFFINAMARIYWAFFGNYYSNWRAFIPLSKKAWDNIKHVLKVDILLRNEEKEILRNHSVGHNYVASLSYLVLFFLALVQIFTGFGLYAPTSGWWLPKLFAWVPYALGDEITTRFVHHIHPCPCLSRFLSRLAGRAWRVILNDQRV